jgi:DUF2075 family protein
MIVYRANKRQFQKDVYSGEIDHIIYQAFKQKFNRSTSAKEVESWHMSLNFMAMAIHGDDIPQDVGVAIECQIPQTSKRIDFILSGFDGKNQSHIVIVELKQWKSAELTGKDGIVRTALGRGLHETSHPSYQAWSYAAMLEDFSTTVQEEQIGVNPCAYLHNYEDDQVIRNQFYQEYLQKAPVFLKRDRERLKTFIKKYVKKGDNGEVLFRIEQGKIRPSKQLAEALVKMVKGNREFILVDEQKLVFETALHLTKVAQGGNKQVMIVEGGPGTGKSVVAINLLVEITRRGWLTQYVTKNAAPRAVYQSKLTGTLTKTRFGIMFQGSGRFVNAEENEFDALVVDEAHRLMAKSGLYGHLGENQVKEIIHAAKHAIFFIDEDQRIHFKDIGTKVEIKKWAQELGARIHEYELPSQFRCNGSDGYLAFLDHALQIRETANPSLEDLDYDFQVVESPNTLREFIVEKNQLDNKARLVAGYCWDWKSKTNVSEMDVIIPEHQFAMQWNLSVDGSLWILQPTSIDQIGCIHTCQGLELSYVGVIIGDDLIVRDGKVLVDPSQRSRMDSSIKGYKTLLKKNPEEANRRAEFIIKNTYRTLMTRGMKGCYLYCTDEETREYFGRFQG